MSDLLIQLARHYALKLLQLPSTLWIEMQWADLRFRETGHLLRLDDYLLKDMGLRKVDGRIEAIDPARIDPRRSPAAQSRDADCPGKRAREAN